MFTELENRSMTARLQESKGLIVVTNGTGNLLAIQKDRYLAMLTRDSLHIDTRRAGSREVLGCPVGTRWRSVNGQTYH